jgi:hypothetical protein
MDAPPLSLSSCLSEIVAEKIPWAGDPGADFNTGLYAVLDHAEDNASAVMYYRPQSHQFLMYVYVPSHDEHAAAHVADAVTRYLRRPSALYSLDREDGMLPGEELHELDRVEARRRLAALQRVLAQPAEDQAAYRVY